MPKTVQHRSIDPEQQSLRQSLYQNYKSNDSQGAQLAVQASSSEDSDASSEFEEKKTSDLDEAAAKVLSVITSSFSKTYKDIKKNRELSQFPLSDYTKEEIQEYIRIQRQKITRQNGGKTPFKSLMKPRNQLCKRARSTYPNFTSIPHTQKRQKKDGNQCDKQSSINSPWIFFSENLLENFNTMPQLMQEKMIQNMALVLEQDQKFSLQCLNTVVEGVYGEAYDLFCSRDYSQLTVLLEQACPMVCVALNLMVAQNLTHLADEGTTLEITFVPYLRSLDSFNFLQQEMYPMCQHFAATICQHYHDLKQEIGVGFCSFAIEFGPQVLALAVQSDNDIKNLQSALEVKGFSPENSYIISQHPTKFLWPGLLKSLASMNNSNRNEIILILSKLIILEDPTIHMVKLLEIFASRRIFALVLLQKEQIHKTLSEILLLFESMKGMSGQQITQCLSQEPSQWNNALNTIEDEKPLSHQGRLSESLIAMYNEHVEHLPQETRVHPQDLIKFAKEIQIQCPSFLISEYQCTVVSSLLSQKDNVKIILIPTGSGKTWIQALTSKYLISKGEKVTLVEPNQNLKMQTIELIGAADPDLSIITMEEFYENPPQNGPVLVNEYDFIVESRPFMVARGKIIGLWILQNRNVMFFSASSNSGIERIIHKNLGPFKKLCYQSEFELVHQVSPLSTGDIQPCKDQAELLNCLVEDIGKNYNILPLVVFCDHALLNNIIDAMKKRKWTKFRVGPSQDNLREIRTWTTGVLLLTPDDSIGINCRFARDSLVLISHQLSCESQYLQAKGRSSRVRGLCKSIYYPITEMNAQQVAKSLQKQDLSKLHNLSALIKMIWTKRNNKSVQEALLQAQQSGDTIISLKDLEQVMGSKSYQKIAKNVEL